MERSKFIPSLLASILALLSLTACTDTPTPVTASTNMPGLETTANELSRISSASPSLSTSVTTYDGNQVGIWTTGEGVVATSPTLATVNIGVESISKTIAHANSQAVRAMDKVIDTLQTSRIKKVDIKTNFFNVAPEYRYNEKSRKQELVGYRVSNQISVKIRDLDNLGQIIDYAISAGGDLIRIQGITFTVEDTTTLEVEARELAVQNALLKAEQFANLTGVSIGRLVYIGETGGIIPRTESYGTKSMAMMAESATPIYGGEITVTASVQAIFNIR